MARARRHDPERRERIVDAAVRVVRRAGVGGVSHRTVAAEADVPLGSTTYHFASLDDLLAAAFRTVCEEFRGRLRATPAPADPAAALARLMGEWLDGSRTGIAPAYELHLAALRRPALRPVAAEWTGALVAALGVRTDPATARALVALVDGLCLRVLVTGGSYDEEHAREMLARLLTEPPNRPDRGSSEPPGRSTDT
ncbi:TetR/AcrR family transcriptional regulator [Streptomyces sp. NPDC003327]